MKAESLWHPTGVFRVSKPEVILAHAIPITFLWFHSSEAPNHNSNVKEKAGMMNQQTHAQMHTHKPFKRELRW